jgi:Arc/MetJ-type ribon-helix-helix transcriptional regulator
MDYEIFIYRPLSQSTISEIMSKKRTLSGKVPDSYVEEVLKAVKDHPDIYPTKSEFVRKAARRELDSVLSTAGVRVPSVQTWTQWHSTSADSSRPVRLHSRVSGVRGEPPEGGSHVRPTDGESSIVRAGRAIIASRPIYRRQRPPRLGEFVRRR